MVEGRLHLQDGGEEGDEVRGRVVRGVDLLILEKVSKGEWELP